MDAAHLPAVIGTCAYCGLPLYALAPIAHRYTDPALTPAHVACEVDAHRRAAPHP